jgi:hypothetical protein
LRYRVRRVALQRGSLEHQRELTRPAHPRVRWWQRRRRWRGSRQIRNLPSPGAREFRRVRRARGVFLIGQPLSQMPIRRRLGDYIRDAFIIPNLQQLSQRFRRQSPQPRQQRVVFRILAPDKQMHRHVPPAGNLPRAKSLGTLPRKRIDQFVFLIKIHCAVPPSTC